MVLVLVNDNAYEYWNIDNISILFNSIQFYILELFGYF